MSHDWKPLDEVGAKTFKKARATKTHNCCMCDTRISTGDLYFKEVRTHDGKEHVKRYCGACEPYANEPVE